MIRIELTGPEILLGANVGVLRRYHAIMKGRREYFVEPDRTWSNEITGAHAELSFAKHKNVFWSGTVGCIDLPDVGPYEIRSKPELGRGMWIRPGDPDDAVFVSIAVVLPYCWLTGWMLGREAKRECWQRESKDRSQAYLVPEGKLEPIESLPRT